MHIGAKLGLAILAAAQWPTPPLAAAPRPRLVKDIRPTGGISLTHIAADPARLWFTSSREFWVSDGTEVGTVLLMRSADSSSQVATAGGIGYMLTYHMGADYPTSGDLWRSDGTPAGTFNLVHFDTCATSMQLTPFGNRLLFDDCSSALWITDGTVAGTVQIGPPGTTMATVDGGELGGFLFFGGCDAGGCGLFRTDGTATGTVAVLYTDPPDRFRDPPYNFARIGGRLGFTIRRDWTFEIWSTDGTAAGTRQEQVLGETTHGLDRRPQSGPWRWFGFSERATGRELYSSASSAPFLDLCPGTCGGSGSIIAEVAGGMLIYGADREGDFEPWFTDGTAAGTQRLKEIVPGPEPGMWGFNAAFDSKGWFVANDGRSGLEVWYSDGTAGGTQQLADLNPGSADAKPSYFTPSGQRLFFFADDGVHGNELWVVDAFASAARTLLRLDGFSSLDPLVPARSTVLPVDPVRDRYLPLFQPGAPEPEQAILEDVTRPLVLYALDGPGRLLLYKGGEGDLRIDW